MLPIKRNGTSQSWGHITIVIPELPYRFTGFTEISYDDTIDEAKEGGLGASRATRRSVGIYTANDPKLTGSVSDVNDFLQELAKRGVTDPTGKKSVNGVVFNVQIGFSLTENDPPHLHELNQCRVKSIGDSYTYGPDLLKQDLTLSCMEIVRDDIVLYDLASEALF